MLSDADYKELKAQQKNLNGEGRTALREYELSNPQHGVEASGIQKLDETAPAAKGVNVPELPADKPAAPVTDKLQALSDEVNAPAPNIDATRDEYLPNASHLKALDVPPEYVSKNPMAGIKHVAMATLKDPLDGPSAGTYFEPSEKQFTTDMGPVLKARGILPGSEEFTHAFAEYKDRKWAQAYQDAQANDTPLTRAEYVPHATGWDKLKGMLAEAPDVASAFAKGFASGGTLHATDALETDADKEQAERDPYARGAGELIGSMRTTGPLAKITKGAGDIAAKFLPGGFVSRLAGGALAGGVAGVADLVGRETAAGIRSTAHGGTAETAKDTFVRSLPGALATGAGFGLGGQLVAEGANALQKSTLSSTPEIGQLRRGGGDTDLLRGVKPGPDVTANVEAAREPIPGEAKAPPDGNATELAAKKVQGPLAQANATAHADTHATIAAEQDAAIQADPKLQERVPAAKTAQAAVDWALSKLQPEARPGYLPGISKLTNAEQLPGADLAEVQKIAPRLWKPRIVNAVDASSVVNRARGRAITLDEARQLGLDVGALAKELGPETGVPLDAPPIPDESSSVGAVRERGVVNSTYARDGMRDLTDARSHYAGKTPEESEQVATSLSKPIDVAVEPGGDGKHIILQDGRHRMTAAQEAGAKNILARIRTYDADGNTVKLETAVVPIESLSGGSTAEEVFGRPADVITPPRPGTTLSPREGRAFKTPTGPLGSEWFDQAKAAETVALHSGDYAVSDPFGGWKNTVPSGQGPLDTPTTPGTPEAPPSIPSIRPTGAPSALRAAGAPIPPPAASAATSGPAIGGVPESQYRVILEPRTFDAKTFEEILGDVDRKAKAGSATATPDPAWKQLQRAIREDRSQFGPEWTDLIAKHHDMLNDVEQRSYHAGMVEKKPYSEMQGSSQQTLNGKLVDFPGGTDSAKALRELAQQADPAVQHDLEVLGAQNAYSKLKGMANPKIGETVGAGGIAGHLRGFGPAVRLRTDALARGVSAGPTGEPTITPRLADFVRQNAPRPKFLAGMTAMGAGSLGLKAGSVYNSTRDRGQQSTTLTPQERQFLDQLIQATQEAP